MNVETRRLYFSELGGDDVLRESALMSLFADGILRATTTPEAPTELVDSKGRVLSPSYYYTQLHAPVAVRPESFKRFDSISVGVDVSSFGKIMCSAEGVLGSPQAVEAAAGGAEDRSNLIQLRAGFIMLAASVPGQESEPAVASNLPELAKLKKPPESAGAFSKVFTMSEEPLSPALPAADPVDYWLVPNRDVPPGHSLTCMALPKIMDYAEHAYLVRGLVPGFSTGVLEHLSLVEREVYFVGSCGANETLSLHVTAQLSKPAEAPDVLGADRKLTAKLTTRVHAYSRDTNSLIATSNSVKIAVIPVTRKSLLQECDRVLAQYGS